MGMNHDLWNITRIWMVGETFEHDIHGKSQMYDVSTVKIMFTSINLTRWRPSSLSFSWRT